MTNTTPAAALSPEAIAAAIDKAIRRIAPVWPLKHFVAVNPFLGVSEQSFGDAVRTMDRVAGARMLMPRRYYADAITKGRITDADLSAALGEATPTAGLPGDAADLKRLAIAVGDPGAPGRPIATVADAATTLTGEDWAVFVTDRIARWAGAYFDDGQSSWQSPGRALPPYPAWRTEAALDRTPEVMGLKGFRAAVSALPEDAETATKVLLEQLAVPADGLDDYLHRLLMSIGGWAAFARYQVWEAELYGGSDTALAELLAIRLAWDGCLLKTVSASGLDAAWSEAKTAALASDDEAVRQARAVDLVLHDAYEKAWQRGLISQMAEPKTAAKKGRPSVQAAFCIDVRSEVYRRALESVSPDIETIGFAGFFGFPIEYVPLGLARGGAQCPVLLTPQYTVCETVKDADAIEEMELLGLRMLRRRAGKAWTSFKLAAVSSFGFVETMGLGFAAKLASDSLRLTRTVDHPMADGIDRTTRLRLAPRLAATEIDGRATGFDAAERVAMAEAVLKAMSMTENFARLVLLAGHGSTTVNNPHATGLDCGACGGHTGEANARVAAAILNDPDVRKGLVDKGITIPDDTFFLGGLHDTTTDTVTIFDFDQVLDSHLTDVVHLNGWLSEAAHRTRTERARLLNVNPDRSVDRAVVGRSRDWSQVRPEWGLAGCAAFIAAPRRRTEALDLDGRSFLHSYDWTRDEGFGVLELIMTAPMVVASWISLQYYGSTVDNRTFGSGNKVLHNVVGTLGVLEGNGGDLRVGLPWQSVHDGEGFVHEPLRLNVLIEAPTAAMDAIIDKNEAIRHLLDNGWLHLFAIGPDGAVAHRYRGGLTWEPVAANEKRLAA